MSSSMDNPLLKWVTEGKIKTHISHRFPFTDVMEALAVIAKRDVVGKAVLYR